MKYDVTFEVIGTTTIRVEANDEDEAEDLAREIADDGFELDDGDIEECYDITEVVDNQKT